MMKKSFLTSLSFHVFKEPEQSLTKAFVKVITKNRRAIVRTIFDKSRAQGV